MSRSSAARPRGLSRQRAFSLVEIMVAMVLGLLLTSAAVSLFLSVRQLQIEQERVVTLKENLRFATDFMMRDIRGAGLRDDGAWDRSGALEPAQPGAAEQQQFTVRKTGMNCLGEVGPWVASTYSVYANQLRCGNAEVPPQTQPLVSGIRSMVAVALDASGQPDWEHPVALRIELELESAAGGEALTHTMQFVVSLRNAVLDQYQSL